MTAVPTPSGYATLNPFFITRDADGLMSFLQDVFGGHEHPGARTVDVDGLLLHAELEVGGTTLMFAERKPGWPFLPQLTQIYVAELDGALARARDRGAEVVTDPTDFFGTAFSRVRDPWGNLWWVYQHGEMPETDWADAGGADGAADDAPAEAWTDPGLAYIHRTLLETMPSLGADPRAGNG